MHPATAALLHMSTDALNNAEVPCIHSICEVPWLRYELLTVCAPHEAAVTRAVNEAFWAERARCYPTWDNEQQDGEAGDAHVPMGVNNVTDGDAAMQE